MSNYFGVVVRFNASKYTLTGLKNVLFIWPQIKPTERAATRAAHRQMHPAAGYQQSGGQRPQLSTAVVEKKGGSVVS